MASISHASETKLNFQTYFFQIELDLLRTLPRNRHYEDLQSEGVPKLRRILLAYTQHNPDIGYCQVRGFYSVKFIIYAQTALIWKFYCMVL